jgi:multidrug resistance efflux pump
MTSLGTNLQSEYVQSQIETSEPLFLEVRPPWAFSVAVASGLVTLSLALFLLFGRVDSVVHVRGVMLPVSGVFAVSSERGGTVRRVLVSSGQQVNAGDPLVVVESGDMVVGRSSATESFRLAREQARQSEEAEDAAFAREKTALDDRRRLVSDQEASLERTRHLTDSQVETDRQMERSGLISHTQTSRDEAELEQVTRLVIASRQERVAIEAAMNTARSRHTEQLLQRRREIDHARNELRTADIRAQEETAGSREPALVDTVLVHEGETVRGGQALLRLIPRGSLLHVIAYVPEQNRQQIRVGTEALVGFDQLRDERFHGHITRIGDFPASRNEVDATVGWGVPVDYAGYRIEISLDDGRDLVYAGMLGEVKVRVGKVRPLSLLLGSPHAGSGARDLRR